MSESIKWLSGIEYYGFGTILDIFFTTQDLYNPVYATANQSLISSTYFSNIPKKRYKAESFYIH